MLSDSEYTRILPTPAVFRAPALPSVLVIDPQATPIEAVHVKEQHREMVRVYR